MSSAFRVASKSTESFPAPPVISVLPAETVMVSAPALPIKVMPPIAGAALSVKPPVLAEASTVRISASKAAVIVSNLSPVTTSLDVAVPVV